VLALAMQAGHRIYSAAYIMPPGSRLRTVAADEAIDVAILTKRALKSWCAAPSWLISGCGMPFLTARPSGTRASTVAVPPRSSPRRFDREISNMFACLALN
jgi:hypothetical protein